MKRLLVAEQWDSWARAVVPRDASAAQRREMRRAFYAGGQAVLFGVVAAFAPEHEPTLDDIAVLDGVRRELSDFAEAVKAGRA